MIKVGNTEIMRIADGKNLAQMSKSTVTYAPYYSPYRVYAGDKLVFPTKEEITPRYCLHLHKTLDSYYYKTDHYSDFDDIYVKTSLPIYLQEYTTADAPEGEDWWNSDILINPKIVHTGFWKRIEKVLAFGLPFIERGSIEENRGKAAKTWSEIIKMTPPPAERDSTFIYITRTRTGSQNGFQKAVFAYTPSVYRRRKDFDGWSSYGDYYVFTRQYLSADDRFDPDNYDYLQMLSNNEYEHSTRFGFDMMQTDIFCNGEVFCPMEYYWVYMRGSQYNNFSRDYLPFFTFYNGALSYLSSFNQYSNYRTAHYTILENNNPSYGSYEEWLEDIKQDYYNPKPPLYDIPF